MREAILKCSKCNRTEPIEQAAPLNSVCGAYGCKGRMKRAMKIIELTNNPKCAYCTHFRAMHIAARKGRVTDVCARLPKWKKVYPLRDTKCTFYKYGVLDGRTKAAKEQAAARKNIKSPTEVPLQKEGYKHGIVKAEGENYEKRHNELMEEQREEREAMKEAIRKGIEVIDNPYENDTTLELYDKARKDMQGVSNEDIRFMMAQALYRVKEGKKIERAKKKERKEAITKTPKKKKIKGMKDIRRG